MNKKDEEKFAIFMAMLATAFEPNGVSKNKINLYFEYLKDIDINLIEMSVHQIIRTRKYQSYPTVAEIREKALGSDDDIETAAVIAWSEAVRSSGRITRTVSPETDEAVKMAFGSWSRFGETDTNNESADRAHFLRCFKSIARKKRDGFQLQAGPTVKMIERGN